MAQTRRLRVLTVVDRPIEAGGGEQLARTIAMRLDPARFERFLCATRPVAALDLDPILAAGVRVLCLERRSRFALTAWRPLISFLRRERIDVLHTHKFGSNAWGTPIGRLARVPVIIAHEHTWSYEGQLLRRALDRHVVARAATVVLAVSREDRRRMIEVERIDPDRIRFVPNGIPQKPAGNRAAVRAELEIPAEAPVIGTVASLRPQKALHFLVECTARLVQEFPDLRVLIVGEGDDEARIRALIRSHGLGRTIAMLGERSDVADVLAAIDVAVSTSDWEGSPLAVMEYMAAGKPIVATCVGGVPDLIEDGVQGLLVERGNVHGLADAVATLLRDPGGRSSIGAEAQLRQRREFDVDQMVRRLETLYEELFRETERARHDRRRPGTVREHSS